MLFHTFAGSSVISFRPRWSPAFSLTCRLTRCTISTYLIFIPCLCILHASEGRIRESKGTKGRRESAIRTLSVFLLKLCISLNLNVYYCKYSIPIFHQNPNAKTTDYYQGCFYSINAKLLRNCTDYLQHQDSLECPQPQLIHL